MTVLKKTHVITVMRVYPIRRMRTMKYRKRLTVRAETGIPRISKFQVTVEKEVAYVEAIYHLLQDYENSFAQELE